MRNLDIADSRNKLEQYAATGQLSAWSEIIGELSPGGAQAIAAGSAEAEAVAVESDTLDHAAIESGTD
jgi:argininosuccinate synthase